MIAVACAGTVVRGEMDANGLVGVEPVGNPGVFAGVTGGVELAGTIVVIGLWLAGA